MKDYYSVLEVSRSATQEEIKKSYHKLAHQYHPDFNNATERVKKLAEEKFKELQEAYNILGNSDKRKLYDKKLKEFDGSRARQAFTNNKTSEQSSVFNTQTVNSNKSSKKGKYWVGVLASVITIALIRLAVSAPSSPNTDNTNIANSPQINNSLVDSSNNVAPVATDEDPFPMQQTSCNAQGCPQYDWYDRHNVSMAYRCYPSQNSECTASEWARAVYGDSSDPRGSTLKQQADLVAGTVASQYPSGKCVTESGLQICDLSTEVVGQTGSTRTIKVKANEIICEDLANGKSSDADADTISLNTDPQYCASDFGNIYIDPTIAVNKYYGSIQDNGSSWVVPETYFACIWTYNGGNADIPYVQLGNQVGPADSFYNVHAFCDNGSLNIYTSSQ
jgi:curved DNA-binding protein CbpA